MKIKFKEIYGDTINISIDLELPLSGSGREMAVNIIKDETSKFYELLHKELLNFEKTNHENH